MSVRVGEIIEAARKQLAVIPSETAGYLSLGVADRVAQAGPATFDPRDIELDERGVVTVPGIRPAAQDQIAGLLRSLLRELLTYAPAGSAALARVATADESN